MKAVWEDVVYRNMYLTGGIGSSGSNEGFSEDYDLPNLQAYCETCASVGMVLWNQRMAQLTGLAEALIEEKNLRISDHTFFFELLRDRGLIVGRLEARVTGPMAASRTRDWEFDPGIEAIAAPGYSPAALEISGPVGSGIRPPR